MIRENFSIKIEKKEGTRTFERKVSGTFYRIGIDTNGWQRCHTPEMTREEMQVLIGYLITWDKIEKEKEENVDRGDVEDL